jgi:hypothetical protein
MKSFKEFNVTEGHDRYPGDDMTQKELRIAINSASNILEMIDNGATIMRWQISAIVKASDELASVSTSMSADMGDYDMGDDSDEMEYEYSTMYGEGYEEDDIALGGTVIYKQNGMYNLAKATRKGRGVVHTSTKDTVPLYNIVSTDLSDWNSFKNKPIKESTNEANSPYRKAATALWNAAQPFKGRDREDLMMHHKLLRSVDPADHKSSSEFLRNLDTAMGDIVSDAVHRNSSKANSLKWHKAAKTTRIKD